MSHLRYFDAALRIIQANGWPATGGDRPARAVGPAKGMNGGNGKREGDLASSGEAAAARAGLVPARRAEQLHPASRRDGAAGP